MTRTQDDPFWWHWQRLRMIRLWRRALRRPGIPADYRERVRARLRIEQERLVRMRLARRMGDALAGGPYTIEDHTRLFDALAETTAGIETWGAVLTRTDPKNNKRRAS